jgi:ATP-binding cassette subfamily C (CFTR/MRP) protein 1
VAYSQSQVIFLDDPLSAVNAYIGKAILENCLLHGPLANRMWIFVTHVLHILSKTNLHLCGVITEQGSYEVDNVVNTVTFTVNLVLPCLTGFDERQCRFLLSDG